MDKVFLQTAGRARAYFSLLARSYLSPILFSRTAERRRRCWEKEESFPGACKIKIYLPLTTERDWRFSGPNSPMLLSAGAGAILVGSAWCGGDCAGVCDLKGILKILPPGAYFE